jgi:hypothetical protein
VIRLRLLGDAQRTSASPVACRLVDAVNVARNVVGLAPIQTGSLAALDASFITSTALSAAKQALSAVATGSQAGVILAAPGLVLAGLQSPDVLDALSLPGAPIPTGFWSSLYHHVTRVVVVGGPTMLGFFAGVGGGMAVCGPVCAVIGGVGGAYIGLKLGEDLYNSSLPGSQLCYQDSDCTYSSDKCLGGTCVDQLYSQASALLHLGAGGCTSCTTDNDCAAGILCIENCCIDPNTYAQMCHGGNCSQESDCSNGDTCLYGCCRGVCGIFGRSCSTLIGPQTCGVTYQTCNSGMACSNDGCCTIL